MPKIVPDRRYTLAEMAAFRDNPEMDGWAAQGYVWQANLDGTVQLVHWTKSDMHRGADRKHTNRVLRDKGGVALSQTESFDVDIGAHTFKPPPIERRTRQERKESLVKLWWDSCRKAGTVPGLSDDQISALFGREWVTGKSELTMEDVRAMAAAMLGDADNKFEASERKKVTRTAPSD